MFNFSGFLKSRLLAEIYVTGGKTSKMMKLKTSNTRCMGFINLQNGIWNSPHKRFQSFRWTEFNKCRYFLNTRLICRTFLYTFQRFESRQSKPNTFKSRCKKVNGACVCVFFFLLSHTSSMTKCCDGEIIQLDILTDLHVFNSPASEKNVFLMSKNANIRIYKTVIRTLAPRMSSP
jgi:hypothetical protein